MTLQKYKIIGLCKVLSENFQKKVFTMWDFSHRVHKAIRQSPERTTKAEAGDFNPRFISMNTGSPTP